ncbi:MAG: 8-oxo-dGTP diphosphatase [Minisyncoccia bacterium]
MERKLLTLCILQHEGRFLLGMKKKGMGTGNWNGFGGKVEEGEAIEVAAKREMQEESGVIVLDLEEVGVLMFTAPTRPPLEMHIFKSTKYTGTPIESDEMKPEWFYKDELPFGGMWSSDLYWWPLFLRGKRFTGDFVFDENDKVISHELTEVI